MLEFPYYLYNHKRVPKMKQCSDLAYNKLFLVHAFNIKPKINAKFFR